MSRYIDNEDFNLDDLFDDDFDNDIEDLFITMEDEDGIEADYQFLVAFELEPVDEEDSEIRKYVAFTDASDDADDDDNINIYIWRVDTIDGETVLASIEDEEEMAIVEEVLDDMIDDSDDEDDDDDIY